ncbi:MAG TPA: ABC transporter permease [Polyangiaceae bacterium]|jgi:putative ABC transport system permease protein|nr:ABC transporter permease [Polyangiaceae bacterium]
MFDLDSWQEIATTLARNKLRAFLTACGVFWGIFMLVALLGLGNGLERGTRKNMGGLMTRAVFVWTQRTSLPYRGLQPGRYLKLRNDDIDAVRHVRGVQYVAPRLQLGGWREGQMVTAGEKSGNFTVMGDVPEFRHVEPFRVLSGRFLNDPDLAEARKVAVLGDQTRAVLFGDENPIGRNIQIKGVFLTVIGEVTTDKTGDDGDRVRAAIFVPFSTFQRAFNQRDRVGWFSLTTLPGVAPEPVEAAVKAAIAERHSIHPLDQDALGSFNLAKQIEKVDGLFRGIRLFVWFVGTLTLLAGVLGVSNILLITVKERTREIGVRKALGATPWSVISMILKEAVVLTSLSGYLGLVAGVGALELVGKVLIKLENAPLNQPEIDVRVALLAMLILVLSGTLAGIVPARHAARISPVEALRTE